MAKTQYSFSTDPLLMGAPTGHDVSIREIRLATGAEFLVVICGAIMTMPGLPRVPAAEEYQCNRRKAASPACSDGPEAMQHRHVSRTVLALLLALGVAA